MICVKQEARIGTGLILLFLCVPSKTHSIYLPLIGLVVHYLVRVHVVNSPSPPFNMLFLNCIPSLASGQYSAERVVLQPHNEAWSSKLLCIMFLTTEIGEVVN